MSVLASVLSPVLQPVLGSVFGASVRSALQPWQEALPALRDYIAANYGMPNPHNQTAMPNPPAVTVTDATQPAGLTSEKTYVGGAPEFSYRGGANKLLSPYRLFPVTTYGNGLGNVGNGQQAVTQRIAFRADAAKVSVSVRDKATPNVRFIVADENGKNGRLVSLTGTPLANTGGRCYLQLDFGSKEIRTIIVDGALDQGFEKAGVAPSDSITAVPGVVKRMIVLGDSFAESVGASNRGDGFAMVCGDMLGIDDTWSSGSAGTGYAATAGADNRLKLSQRLEDANTTGPWDMIVICMGLNDRGWNPSVVTSEVQNCLASLRSSNPSAQIFVVGPWDIYTPAAPESGWIATRNAIAEVSQATSGVFYIDATGVPFTKSDGLHPDTAGHKSLGDWLALQIKTAVGA